MNKSWVGIFSLLFFCMACSGEDLVCPESISIKESLEGKAPDGWSSSTGEPARYLEGITLFSGNPSKNISLVPDSDKKSGADRIATWTFSKEGEPIWLVCRYLSTGVTLQKELKKDLSQCQLRYKEAGRTVISIACK